MAWEDLDAIGEMFAEYSWRSEDIDRALNERCHYNRERNRINSELARAKWSAARRKLANEYLRQWRKANREHVSNYYRAYVASLPAERREALREAARIRARAANTAKRERNRAAKLAADAELAEKRRQAKRGYMAKWRAANKPVRDYKREWALQKERMNANPEYREQRRAKERERMRRTLAAQRAAQGRTVRDPRGRKRLP